MTNLEFQFEWTDPGLAKGRELCATWAKLEIKVNDLPITRLSDSRSKSIRDSVDLPLYPLAEWIAYNWWFIFFEYGQTPERTGYSHRHSLKFAREGYALPDLCFQPSGNEVELTWNPYPVTHSGIQFLFDGQAAIDTDNLRDQLSILLETVIRRLEIFDIHDSPLQEEWAAINSSDREESEFCRMAATLGIDPYNFDEKLSVVLVGLRERFSEQFVRQICSISSADRLMGDVQWIDEIIGRLSDTPKLFGHLSKYRSRQKSQEIMRPWGYGYHRAAELRKLLKLNGATFNSFDDLLASVTKSNNASSSVIFLEEHGRKNIDAFVHVKEESAPGFALFKGREDSKNFAFCRALHDYLSYPEDIESLVSGVKTDRQKMNRAFAAEFLAPSSMLRVRIGSGVLNTDEVIDLAEEFGVSSYTIEHQIRNHDLALIEY